MHRARNIRAHSQLLNFILWAFFVWGRSLWGWDSRYVRGKTGYTISNFLLLVSIYVYVMFYLHHK
jgi:hypothetical protein